MPATIVRPYGRDVLLEAELEAAVAGAAARAPAKRDGAPGELGAAVAEDAGLLLGGGQAFEAELRHGPGERRPELFGGKRSASDDSVVTQTVAALTHSNAGSM